MKKKYTFGIIFLFLAILSCGTLFAYFTDHKVKVNAMTFGENVIETEEEFPNPDPKPGDSVKKEVSIKNTGDVPCFVRTKVLFSNDKAESVSTIDINTTDWIKRDDGYYYYKKILPVEKTTTNLMTAVKIADNANLDALEDFDIIIYSESVQSEGYTEEEYLEAFKSLTH